MSVAFHRQGFPFDEQPMHSTYLALVVGYGPSDGRCLPCSGVSGRAIALSPCPSRCDYKTLSQVKIVPLKCISRGASFMCNASTSGNRRNPDFSRQSRHGFSRGRNRPNEGNDSSENPEESEFLSLKNGPLPSLSGSPKFQATATPGPREKEIVELFRKVQAQLREKAAMKEGRKTETSQGQAKESETVDSLLKLLRKHSVEQGKRRSSNSSSSSRDFNFSQSDQNGSLDEEKSTSFFDLNSGMRDEAQEPNASFTRPASNFQRNSPVPRVKYYSGRDTVNSVSYPNTHGKKEKNLVETYSEPEPEPEPEPETTFPDGDVFDELSDEESSDTEVYDDEDAEEQESAQQMDLSALKLPELRALAKSRGLKGFSKLKKGELMELLSGG